MSSKLFTRILITILIIGALSTIVLVGYTIHLQSKVSIITLIGNEG